MAPSITVYGSRLSPFVEKVVRGLLFKRLPFTLTEPNTPLDLRRWNRQTGKMPVVDLDGERLWDSTFILRRLDALVAAPPFWSAEPGVAAAQRLLEDWADESLYWHLMALRWSPSGSPRTAEQIAGTVPPLLRPLVRRVVPYMIGSKAAAQGFGRLPEDVLERELAVRLDDLVTILGDRPFFYADRPSAADFAVHGQLVMGCSGPTPVVNRLLEARPALVAFQHRLEDAAPG